MKNLYLVGLLIFSPVFAQQTSLDFAGQPSDVELQQQDGPVDPEELIATPVEAISLTASLPTSGGISELGNSQTAKLKQRAANNRVWEVGRTATNEFGIQVTATNRIQEMVSGLHFQRNGKWVEADSTIELQDDGTAAVLHGAHLAQFTANINSQASVRLITRDNKLLKSRILGIAYYDFRKEQSVLIAQLKDSVGAIIGDDQVVYADAFTDIKADVRYRNTKEGLEQDIIFREQPPSPEDFNFDPRTTWLEVWTEFFDPPQPAKDEVIRKGWSKSKVDRVLGFGEMAIVEGSAFGLGELPDKHKSFPVQKHWQTVDGRTFLVEEVSYSRSARSLRLLPRPAQLQVRLGGNAVGVVSSKRVLPAQIAAHESADKMRVASTGDSSPGFVLDYAIVHVNDTNFTFRGDTTYYINGNVSLSGTTTIEGGAVLKFTNGASLNILGDLQCQTESYRPAILTAYNDSSVGEVVSTNALYDTNRLADTAINLSNGGTLKNLHIRYASTAIASGAAYDVSSCQFIHCNKAVEINQTSCSLHNVLMFDVTTGFFGHDYNASAEHLTFDQGNLIQDWWTDYELCNGTTLSTLGLTNSLLTDVQNNHLVPVICGADVVFTTATGVYKSLGAGAHYLADDSQYRDIGVTNITFQLLSEIAKKTTFAPLICESNTITTNVVFDRTIARDTGIPDLGYHYDPIDYVMHRCLLTNCSAVLTNGATLATFGDVGLIVWTGVDFNSRGTPEHHNHICRYTTVQEMPLIWYSTPNFYNAVIQPNFAPLPSAQLRFTDFEALAGGGWHLYGNDAWGYSNLVVMDCGFYSGRVDIGGPVTANVALTNNLFERAITTFSGLCSFNCYSSLFRPGLPTGDTNAYLWFERMEGASAWSVKNNLFSEGFLADESWDPITADYNGFVEMTPNRFATGGTHDITLTNITFAKGHFGPYYQTSTNLLNAGSQTSDALGLFHYTVTTNLVNGLEIKETNSVVDIGLHYVAATQDGLAIDGDNDGMPDYAEDYNGNGLYDAQIGETPLYSVAIPSILPSGGTFAMAQKVTISCTTAGATIHYTLNGVEPTELDSTITSGSSLTLMRTAVLRAKAFKSGVPSPVQSAMFSILGRYSIAAGGNHTLALRSDGALFSVGNNTYGQLGDGTTVFKSNFVAVAGISNVMAVAGGDFHSLALLADGSVKAWGNNGNGRLGDGTGTQRTSPVSVANLSSAIAIAAGQSHSLALKSDGTVWAWGFNSSGQLGDGTTTQRLAPVQVTNLSGVIAISVGDNHSLALKSDGTIWAWGNNVNGRLGYTVSGNQLSPVQAVTNLPAAVGIAAGGSHSMALLSDGTVWAWGLNSNGQLGNNSLTSSTNAVQVTDLSSAIYIAAGENHSFAVNSDGYLFTWGDNVHGQLGDGTLVDRKTNVLAIGISNIVTASGGDYHSVAMDSSGNVWVWGYHADGQLGTGQYDYRAIPGRVPGLTNIAGIAAATQSSYAFQTNGASTAFAWGRDTNYELGDRTNVNQPYPDIIFDLTNVVQMEGGDLHAAAVMSNGVINSWGYNGNGRLGDGSTTARSNPVTVTNLTNAIAVASGLTHNLALLSDGTVWSWGVNTVGELGDGTTTQRLTPVPVSGLTNVVKVAAGDTHSLALEADGSVWAWGNNANGRLGFLTPGNQFSPVRVATNLTGIANIAAGGSHSMALLSNGTVWAWGLNASGQLGNKSTVSSTNAVLVTNLTSAVAIAAGSLHSFAILSDGTIRAWGQNDQGQLGDGTVLNRNTNVAVVGLGSIVAVAGGVSHSLALDSSGTVWAWGNAVNGQLGDGNVGYNPNPIQPTGGLNLVERPDDLPPVISISTPTNSSSFRTPANVSIIVTAVGRSAAISNVSIYRDGIILSMLTNAPYQYTWPLVSVGAYYLTAKAKDLNGLSTISSSINISVTNQCGN